MNRALVKWIEIACPCGGSTFRFWNEAVCESLPMIQSSECMACGGILAVDSNEFEAAFKKIVRLERGATKGNHFWDPELIKKIPREGIVGFLERIAREYFALSDTADKAGDLDGARELHLRGFVAHNMRCIISGGPESMERYHAEHFKRSIIEKVKK